MSTGVQVAAMTFMACEIHPGCSALGRVQLIGLSLLSVLSRSARACADDPGRCASLFLSGSYGECASVAREAIARGEREEAWWLWGIRAELIRGRHDDARQLLDTALEKN